MIVLDTSFIYALLDGSDSRHREAAEWYANAPAEEASTTPLVLAETDHLALRLGVGARSAFREDLRAGAYRVDWSPGTLQESVAIAERYRDLGLSLTDASLAALAAELETERVATFDEKHFRAIEPLSGTPAFTLMPMDA